MYYIIIGLIIYITAIFINAWMCYKKDTSHKTWQIAFNMWRDSLHKKGYPRHPSGACMTYWELVDYFDESEEKKIYIDHVNKNWNK